MSNANEYIKRLNELRRKERFRRGSFIYRMVGRESEDDLAEINERYLHPDHQWSRNQQPPPIANVRAAAYHLLKKSIAPKYLLEAARAYEKLGKGKQAVPMLLEGLERARDKKLDVWSFIDDKDVEEFIERNLEGKKPKKERGLESKFVVFALFIAAGIALGAASLSMTGNVVSSLTQIPGLLGILFFIVGVVGMFFWFRRK